MPAPPPTGVRRPIPGELLRLTLPLLASQILRLAYQWVDALWVRGLGVEATAAVTTSVFVVWWMNALNDVFAIGVTAYVSQLLGAGDRERAGVAAWKGVRASACLGLVGTMLGIFGARAIVSAMAADEAMLEQGTSYLSIILLASPFHMMALTCESIMRASGNTRTPFLIDLSAVALNAVLAPFLIYGWGPVPAMGVAGAAWATFAAQATMLSAYLGLALRRHPALPMARHATGPPVRIARMAKVGAPASMIGMLFSVVYIVFARAAGRFGPASLAVVGVANRIEAIEFLTAVAIGTAGAALVGQNLGAGRPDRAAEVLRAGMKWALSIAAIITVALLLWPGFFISLFTNDPEVHRLGEPYLRILSLCLVFTAAEVVTAESVLGSGHTVVISLIYTVTSLVRIPLAFWATSWCEPPVLGIAWLIVITCNLRAIVLVLWAARGSWKTGLGHDIRPAEPALPESPGALT